MEFHKYADLFPLLTGEEFDALVEDIKENGLIEPIYLYQNQILDGRNRWKACEAAGVEPVFNEYNGSDPLSFAVSLNIKRRHLNASQLAMLGAALMPMLQAEAAARKAGARWKENVDQANLPGQARDIAAKMVGLKAERYIDYAVTITEKAPELADDVRAGTMPIGQAYEIAKASGQEAVRKDIAKQVREKHATVAATRTIVAQKTGKTVPAQTPQEKRELEGMSAWQWGLKELRKLISTLDKKTATMVKKNLEDTLKKIDSRLADLEE